MIRTPLRSAAASSIVVASLNPPPSGLIKDRRIRAIQFESADINAVQRTWMRDFYDLLVGYSFYRLLPKGLLPLGEYRPAIYELFRFQNLVALLDALPGPGKAI